MDEKTLLEKFNEPAMNGGKQRTTVFIEAMMYNPDCRRWSKVGIDLAREALYWPLIGKVYEVVSKPKIDLTTKEGSVLTFFLVPCSMKETHPEDYKRMIEENKGA